MPNMGLAKRNKSLRNSSVQKENNRLFLAGRRTPIRVAPWEKDSRFHSGHPLVNPENRIAGDVIKRHQLTISFRRLVWVAQSNGEAPADSYHICLRELLIDGNVARLELCVHACEAEGQKDEERFHRPYRVIPATDVYSG